MQEAVGEAYTRNPLQSLGELQSMAVVAPGEGFSSQRAEDRDSMSRFVGISFQGALRLFHGPRLGRVKLQDVEIVPMDAVVGLRLDHPLQMGLGSVDIASEKGALGRD
ncbi:MAG: hypothetical protein U1G07_20175 [Verrucomicrobiota bacterium]